MKNIRIVHLKIFKFLEVKVSIYLNRRVFVMNRKYNIVMDGVMILHASNQVLCNMWSYHFYDMMLSILTKKIN